MRKTHILAAPVRAGIATMGLVGLLLTAAACTGEADAPSAATSAPDTVPGLTVSNARLILNAVSGQPAVVYFDLSYTGDKGLTIRKADVEGAGMTMMHDYGEYDFKVQMMEALPVALRNGTEISFKPGSLHLMAMEPPAEWEPGGTVKITLTMSGGATHSFDADIRGPGDER
jgi:periplasmic copper chaperone A